MMELAGERRSAHRYSVRMPVILGAGRSGTTTDVSATGLRFECSERFEPGTWIEFELGLGSDSAEKLSLLCSGTVVRTQTSDGRISVAISFDEVLPGH
jgi:hypothetical protein